MAYLIFIIVIHNYTIIFIGRKASRKGARNSSRKDESTSTSYPCLLGSNSGASSTRRYVSTREGATGKSCRMACELPYQT